MGPLVAFCIVTAIATGDYFFAVQDPITYHDSVDACMIVATTTETKFRGDARVTQTHEANCGCMSKEAAIESGIAKADLQARR